MSDGELVEDYLKGGRKSWDSLCERYIGELFGFFVNRTGNCEDARDLAQETLIEAMVNLSELQNPESFRGWLYKIAHGILAKFFRDNASRGIHTPLDEAPAATIIAEPRSTYAIPAYQQPEHLVAAQEHLDIVRSMVDRLPKSEREVFLLKFADPDTPQKEIAKTLGISVNAVKTRWRRGKQNLRKQLEAKYPGEFTYLFE
ncbi:MAG: RNA polymerase sigma factor [Candidatus Poribacteria bacterium]|nr:RNA polymerase sigma factor [Candidatus Poribacteria bacterium]